MASFWTPTLTIAFIVSKLAHSTAVIRMVPSSTANSTEVYNSSDWNIESRYRPQIQCQTTHCEIDCHQRYDCDYLSINASHSDILNLYCSEHDSCRGTYIHCGTNTNLNVYCNAKLPRGRCEVSVSDDVVCNSATYHASYFTDDNTHFKSFIGDNTHDFTCYRIVVGHPMPFSTLLCEKGYNCLVQESCPMNGVINGTASTYLTVEYTSSECKNVFIKCPIGGCSIKCTNCSFIQIEASYAESLHLECHQCNSLVLRANYVNDVNMTFDGKKAYNSSFYVRGANIVAVTSQSPRSFHSNYLYAESVASLVLTCGSYACYQSHYYITEHTILSCYAKGCDQMGTVHATGNTASVQMVVHSCGECKSISDCVANMPLYCHTPYRNQSRDYTENCHMIQDAIFEDDFGGSFRSCDQYKSLSRFEYDASNHCECACDPNACDCVDTDSSYSVSCDCQISCTQHECSNLVVDDSTIYAFMSDEVEYPGEEEWLLESFIVTCKEYDSCYNARIVNPGVVKCEAYGSCNHTEIHSKGEIEIQCQKPESCYDLAIYINIDRHWYSLDVILIANGPYAFANSSLFAASADSVFIQCDGINAAACYGNELYLPSKTVFDCQGMGCNELGNIYTRNRTNHFAFCKHKKDAFVSVDIYCGNNYSYNASYDGYRCHDFNTSYDCGCNASLENMSYSDDIYCEDDPIENEWMGWLVAVAGVIGLICLFVLLYKYCSKHSYGKIRTDGEMDDGFECEEGQKEGLTKKG